MVCERENLSKIVKMRLTLLGIQLSDEELSKLSRDLNNILKISKSFDEILSQDEEPAVFFFLKVEDHEEI